MSRSPSRSRLATALEQGVVALPDGRVTVLRPTAATDLSALPRDRTVVVTGFRPDADHWQAAGWTVGDAAPSDLAVVCLPRAKRLARALVAQAAGIAPVVIVDGQKTDGADALWREARALVGYVPTLTAGHGRLFVLASAGDALAGWADPGPVRGEHGFWTQAGVFSDGEVDRGSALLAAALPDVLPPRMADLGAGWGYLAAAVLARAGVQSVDLIEAEALALDCARRNVTDPRAVFHWADATRFTPATLWDGVVMNPPFHTVRAADPDLGRAFIAAAARGLSRTGTLWMVANRHLPYAEVLADHFGQVETLGQDPAFRLVRAARPLSGARPAPRLSPRPERSRT